MTTRRMKKTEREKKRKYRKKQGVKGRENQKMFEYRAKRSVVLRKLQKQVKNVSTKQLEQQIVVQEIYFIIFQQLF